MLENFTNDCEKANKLIEQKLTEKQKTYFDQFKGKTFRQFWDSLKPNLDFFDYEQELEQILEHNKHVWIKKATGLGISEFFLRWVAWHCLKDNILKDKQIDVTTIIITGPRIELAIQLIDRLKALFDFNFETKNTVCYLNGCKIEAFPSHHLASARGLNPFLVFLDEADFFPPKEQQEARSVSERYIAKTDPHIIMVSTPYLPGGLYEQIEKEENSLYKKLLWNYQVGEGKIYTKERIDRAKQSPSFEREYNLKYGVGVGNIFTGIDDIIEDYDLSVISSDVCIFDPAFGSSMFGILGMGRRSGIIYIKEELELERPSLSFAIQKSYEIAKNYKITLVDSAHPGIIRDLREKGINCQPVNFAQEDENKQTLRSKMTTEAAQAVREKRVRIHKIFTNLASQLRAVKFDSKGGPDKSELTFDLGDCFLMGCNHLKTVELRMIKV